MHPTDPTTDAPQLEIPNPIPWEDPATYPAFWDRVVETFRLAFTTPMAFFERIPQGEGYGRPWGFLIFTTLPNYVLAVLGLALAGVILAILGWSEAKNQVFQEYPALTWILPVALVGLFLLLPFLQLLGMVIMGGLQHLFLWMFGGTRAGLGAQQTIRASTYAWAIIGLATFLPSLIPYLGVLIVIPLQITGMVFTGMGLARLHRTDTWRGLAAVFAPVVLGCCCLVFLWFSLIAGIVLPNVIRDSMRGKAETSPTPAISAPPTIP